VGGSITFTSQPKDFVDVVDTLALFVPAVEVMHQELQAGYELGVHGAAWLASMQGRNRAVRIRHLDTSVDTGYRLLSHAPAGRVLIIEALPPLLEPLGMVVEKVGETSLKGVAVDPYPLMAICRESTGGSMGCEEAAAQVLRNWSN